VQEIHNAMNQPVPSGAGGPAWQRYATFLKWSERVLLVSGLWLLAIYGAARFERFVRYQSALREFASSEATAVTDDESQEADLESVPEADTREIPHATEIDFSGWSRQRLTAYRKAGTRTDAPIAILRIAKIHLEVPVFEGTDELTLNHGVGRIRGTARAGANGNMGIAGHRDGFFRGLKDVREGDEIELQSVKGTQTYVVEQLQIVRPEDVEVLQPREVPTLTLVTCYPFYFIGSAPQRYIVTASLLRETKADREIRIPAPYQQQTEEEKQ
jgi:sortase A